MVQCVYLVNIPEPVQYKIYAPALPFDLRCESGIYSFKFPTVGKLFLINELLESISTKLLTILCIIANLEVSLLSSKYVQFKLFNIADTLECTY